MLATDRKLNLRIMEEMGLTEGDNSRVIDKDDGEICCLGQKEVVIPGYETMEKNLVEFDVVNNPNLMTRMFIQYIGKLQEEESMDENCVSFGTYEVKGTDKSIARMTMVSGSLIESRPYKTEGLCYADLVMKLNGEDTDFTKYDSINRKQPKKITGPKRRRK